MIWSILLGMRNLNLYAKSYKLNGRTVYETIEEHTTNLLKNFDILFNYYNDVFIDLLGNDFDRFKQLLYLAALYHDLGKGNMLFQKKINKSINDNLKLPKQMKYEIYHNFLSPAFFSSKLINSLSEEEFYILFYSIIYHHYRDFDSDEEYFIYIINDDLKNRIKEGYYNWVKHYDKNFDDNDIWEDYYGIVTNRYLCEEYSKNKKFILLKGLLNRLDYSSSANIVVEEPKIDDINNKLMLYLKKKNNFKDLKDFQKEAKRLSNENILLYAPTGSGKTEFGINWISNRKVFYTLPIRTSINAMYERMVNIFGENNIGLLYADSELYILDRDKNDDVEHNFMLLDMARQLSMPITITTADQIFTSALKWPGYEKIYATLAYSQVIIDEPQGYSPDSLAIIIKAIEDVTELGGKFCIMSATINPIIFEKLKSKAIYLRSDEMEKLMSEKKHFIKIKEKDIIEDIENIIANSTGKKVLIIVNTVKKSQYLYNLMTEYILKNNIPIKINLLHSQFIQRDRKAKENLIQNCTDASAIWISTQVVEASLDIDYDILYTELCSIDSLVQRMGRIYRKRLYDLSEPNVFIYVKESSGIGKVYDRDITVRTYDFLKRYDSEFISEWDKKTLVDRIYNLDEIKDTKFYNKFNEYYNILKYGFKSESKSEAQKMFRDISNVTVIPINIYNENKNEIDNLISELTDSYTNKVKKLLAIKKIKSFTANVPYYIVDKAGKSELSKMHGIYLTVLKYDKNIGITGELMDTIS